MHHTKTATGRGSALSFKAEMLPSIYFRAKIVMSQASQVPTITTSLDQLHSRDAVALQTLQRHNAQVSQLEPYCPHLSRGIGGSCSCYNLTRLFIGPVQPFENDAYFCT